MTAPNSYYSCQQDTLQIFNTFSGKASFFLPTIFFYSVISFRQLGRSGSLIYGTKRKMSSGRNAKGSGTVALTLQNAWLWCVRLSRSFLSQRQRRVVHAQKQKQTKDKNDCEAVRKEEERWTDNSERNALGFPPPPVIKHSSLLLQRPTLEHR